MMKRKLIFLALLTAFAIPFSADAEILRWLVNTNPAAGTDFGGNPQNISWEYAALRATTAGSANAAIYGGGGSIVETDPPYEGTQTSVVVQNYVNDKAGVYWVDKSNAGSRVVAELDGLTALLGVVDTAAINFYVELYDEHDILIGYSSAASYSDLASFRDGSRYFAEWTSMSTWNPSDWTAVPEPTSGMLALLGLIALGLRRRRV